MDRFKNAVSGVTMLLGGIVLCLMAVQIVWDVFLRAFAGASFPATPDMVARYYMVAIAFLPLAFTELRRRHIEASLFVDMMPRPAQRLSLALGFFLSAVIYGLMVYGTTAEALKQTERGALVEVGTMTFHTWPSYWILPVSLGLMVIVSLLRLFEVASGRFAEDAAPSQEPGAGEAA